MVVEARPGDVIIFRSTKITYFNMPYNGERASLVLHTNCRARGWVKDGNGWQPLMI